MNKVVVVSLNKRFRFYRKKAGSIVKKILRLFKKRNCYLEIFLISSQKMKFLNKKFRNKNKTTSILTFVEPQNFPHPESKLKPLGEIYLNAEVSSFKFQVSSLLVHGLLHLIGFQHRKKSDRIKMEATEQKLLRQILNPKS
jgi:probable rRNA maturation factor